MIKLLKTLASDQSGATAIEYGLIAAFVALAMVAGFTQTDLAGSLTKKFVDVGTALK